MAETSSSRLEPKTDISYTFRLFLGTTEHTIWGMNYSFLPTRWEHMNLENLGNFSGIMAETLVEEVEERYGLAVRKKKYRKS